MFCQLATLRHCLPSSVQRTLRELPESLDETYERILKEIKKPNRGLAQRVLQCLVVAVRPLRVAELAEVFAVDFDDAEGVPRLNVDWRWEDQEQALLIACSSLIAIVESGDSRIVQFSHFSVKEFLTSSRVATASGEVSAYRIDMEHAHMILAQACLGVLLQAHENTSKDHPLAQYAAQHWTTHAQFGEVSSHLQEGMGSLFDPDKPYFAAWLSLHDIDTKISSEATFFLFAEVVKSAARPVYYAALCGFHNILQCLVTKYPQDVNHDGGYCRRPLVAALAGGHFKTADLLRHYGADLDNRVASQQMRTPMHSAAYYGDLEIVKKLIEYEADISAKDLEGYTPLNLASEGIHLKDRSVLRLLLERGADVNARTKVGSTPLHRASSWGALEIVRLLLDSGADVEAKDNGGRTAIQSVGKHRNLMSDEIRKLLLDYRAMR